MSPDDIETLLVMLCRSRLLRNEAIRAMDSAQFRHDEAHFAAFFRAVVSVVEEYDDTRDRLRRLDLEVALSEELDRLGPAITPEQRNDLLYVPSPSSKRQLRSGLVEHAYREVKRSEFSDDKAISTLRRFLQERFVNNHIRDVFDATAGATIKNLGDVIAESERRRATVEAMGADPCATFDDWDPDTTAVELIPTGLSWLNSFTGGGLVAPEIYGLLGVTGAGKSTLAHALAMDMSGHYRAVARRGDTPELVFVFSYEDPLARMQIRSLSNAARIPEERLRAMKDPETDLARVRLDYEVELARAMAQPIDGFPSEYVRYHTARRLFSQNYVMVDMVQDGRGEGGVEEIVGIISRAIERRGAPAGLVIIDSIDLLVDNMLDASGISESDRRGVIATTIPRIVHKIRRKIAVRFGVPVFITNQVAGADIKKSADKLSAANAQGARGWSKGLDTHIVLDEARRDNGVQMVVCTKSRRGSASRHNYRFLLRRDPQFALHHDVSALYSVVGGEIVSQAIADSIHATPTTRPRTQTTSAEFVDD